MNVNRLAKIYYLCYILDMNPILFGGAWAAIKNSEQKAKKSMLKTYPISHSLVFWLIFGGIFAYIPVIYFTISKKHKWH